VKADVIFLFMHPHVEDRHNTDQVSAGYAYLLDRFPDKVVIIKPGNEGEQGLQMYEAMVRRGIYQSGA
jgi:hypothetical protein